MHGWGGWGLQLAAYIPPLVAEGFRVVTYDGPSHGASDAGRDGPTRSSLPELAEAFQAVVTAQGPAYGVVAHSLGAAATALALRSGFAPRRVVFLAAATDFVHTLDMFQTAFGFGPRVRASFLRRFTRKFGTMESYLDWMRACYLITVTGCPAISVPVGRTSDGLPVGVQLVAAYGADRFLLEAAAALEVAVAA